MDNKAQNGRPVGQALLAAAMLLPGIGAVHAETAPERGSVGFTVTARRARGGRVRLLFEVRDSGIGLKSAEIKQLFKPFSQANEQIAARYGGSGLGLVFVKRVAMAMGGDLKIVSRPGRGSATSPRSRSSPSAISNAGR